MDSPARAPQKSLPMVVYWALLFLGVLAGSSAVIFIKVSTENALLVASYRLLIAAGVLSPLFFRTLSQRGMPYTRRELGWTIVPGLVLALHFITWVIGARMTLAANASLVVNLAPVAMPFFLWLFYREVVNRWEVLGTLLAVTGLGVLVSANYRLDPANAWGDLMCFGSMLAFAAYLALGRVNGARLPLWLYLVPLYTIAGVTSLLVGLIFVNPIKAYSLQNVLAILGLGIVPTVIGHSLLNFSMKHFRGQVVGVANLGQIIFSGLLGMVVLGEFPSGAFYAAAAFIFAGVVVVVTANHGRR